MSFRDYQKEQREKVSRSLMDSALSLAAAQGYASLSLRSVAREAGIAPTSFYRHFRDMDELGLALAEQAEDVLRACWKGFFSKAAAYSKSPGASVDPAEAFARLLAESLLACVAENPGLMQLFFQERTGSSPAMRRAISRAMDGFTDVLSGEIFRFFATLGTQIADPRMHAEIVMAVAQSACLDLAVDPDAELPRAVEDLSRKLVHVLSAAGSR
ncbi:MAG: TetR family transcriptional regulator [Thermodesulfobacteriota bacterium]